MQISIPIKNDYFKKNYSLESSTGSETLYIFHKGNLVEISRDQLWFWTEDWQKGEERVDYYIEKGEVEEFDTMEDFLRTLED